MKTVKINVDGKEIDAVIEVEEEDNIDLFLPEDETTKKDSSINLEDTMEIPVVSGEDNEE